MAPAGPQPSAVYFAEGDRQTIIVQFTGNADQLGGGDKPEQWKIYDKSHPPGIDGWFIVNGVDEFGEKYPQPIANGYPDMPAERQLNDVVQLSVPIRNVTVDSARRQIRIDLVEKAGEGATVSYAYISHILGTLTNGQGYPAPGFTYVPIPSEEINNQARAGRP